jgi:anti-sigma regulatory factor (Ser/Thr protein kinase)
MDTLTRPPGTGIHSVELGATLEAARAARSCVADVLTAWDVPADLIDTARLLTSELASNAVTHGQGEGSTFTVEVRSFGCCFGVDVADHSPSAPVVRSLATDIEHGRGLLLVAEVPDSWGYYFEGGRKHVWFHLRISDLTPPPQACQVAPAA